jgi:AraC-like DNA-binding protein
VIETIIPNSPILKKHIECFYIYDGKSNSKYTYVAFPHYNTGLSFFKGATIKRSQRSLEISDSTSNGLHIEILGKYTSPVLLEYNGLVREISIVFKPMGINRFISNNYQSIAPNFSQEFTNIVWRHFGEDLFYGEDDLSKLESFLLSQFSENQELINIEKSLKLLEKGNEETTVSDISSKVGLTLKTFQRHFIKHMGCSPIEYRRICRFRNSLTSKLNSSELKNLTEITYEEGYYDQSYFIKEFRKLTNHNPKDFFKFTSKVDGDKIVWELK